MCLCPTLCNHMDYSLPDSFVYGDSPDKNTGVGCHALLQGIFPTQESNPGLPHFCRDSLQTICNMQTDSLPYDPPGKPKNIEVGSLSLFKGNFPTQETNQVLLHCGRFFTS